MEQLLSMSISASILILILLILQRFCGKLLPKRCFVWLSMVVILRLLLPVQIPVLPDQIPTVSGALQVLGLQGNHTNASSHASNRSAQDTASNVLRAENTAKAAHSDHASARPSGLASAASDNGHFSTLSAFLRVHSTILMLLWLCGVLICGGLFLHRLRKEYGILRQSLPLGRKEVICGGHVLQIPLYYSDQITSPVTFGILHCCIVLPKAMLNGDLSGQDYILLHECMHIRHLDNLKKVLASFCVCIHWFSPLVWIWLFLFYQDLELACDEAVLTSLGRDSRESYALTLITFMEQNQNRSIMNCGFGQTAVKERIVSIMNYKKKGLLSVTLSAALLCSSLTVFAANKPADTKAKSEAENTSTAETESESKTMTESEPQKNSLAKTQDTGNTQTTTEAALDSETDEYNTQLTDMDIYYTAEDFSKTSFFTEYEKQGLSYDKDNKALMFDGKRVIYITDDYSKDKGLIYEDSAYLEISSEVAYTSATLETISDENDTEISSGDTTSEGSASENASDETDNSNTPESADSTANNIVFLYATRDKDWNLIGFDIGWDSIWTDSATENVESSSEDDYSTAIIGGADGPTSIFLAGKLGSQAETKNEQ